MPRNEVVVGFSEDRDRWLVALNGEVRSQHQKKQPAEKEGRRVAKKKEPSKFTVQRKDGGISYEQFYGNESGSGMF